MRNLVYTQGGRPEASFTRDNEVISNMPWYGSHGFLTDYIREHGCRKIMEIGVLNGDNAVNMVETAKQVSPPGYVEYYGFDFFANYDSREVARKLEGTRCKFRLFKGDTTETLPEAVNTLPKMDLIFIDGGKSYSEAKSDWDNSRKLMHEGTAVFVHNYEFSGVRRMVNGIPRDEYLVTTLDISTEGEVALIRSR